MHCKVALFSDNFSVTWALLLSGTVGEVIVRAVSLSVVTRQPVPQKKAPAFVGQGTRACRAWIMCSCGRTFAGGCQISNAWGAALPDHPTGIRLPCQPACAWTIG
jgi:hypothetical protein